MQKECEMITSRQNPLVQLTASLVDRKHRQKEGLFRFDGRKLLLEALAKKLPLVAILYRASAKEELCRLVADKDLPAGVRTVVLEDDLFDRISEDYPELQRNRKKLVETIYDSPYYNALQIRFAYAVTCHKAQGGQWKRVFIDPSNIPTEERDKNYYRWLYTAVTRATEHIYLLKY
jgi:hypothetical protein